MNETEPKVPRRERYQKPKVDSTVVLTANLFQTSGGEETFGPFRKPRR